MAPSFDLTPDKINSVNSNTGPRVCVWGVGRSYSWLECLAKKKQENLISAIVEGKIN